MELTVSYRRGIWGSNLPPKFRCFAKAEPNSQFREIYIRNNYLFVNCVQLLTRGLPPTDPRFFCPLSSTKFVEPSTPKKNSWCNSPPKKFPCMPLETNIHMCHIESRVSDFCSTCYIIPAWFSVSTPGPGLISTPPITNSATNVVALTIVTHKHDITCPCPCMVHREVSGTQEILAVLIPTSARYSTR
jgi:hypothetical protein